MCQLKIYLLIIFLLKKTTYQIRILPYVIIDVKHLDLVMYLLYYFNLILISF